MKNRFIAFGLTLAVLFALLPGFDMPANALYSSFTDISGHWAEDVIDRWAANGVLVPESGTTTFRPSDNITRGELALIISRMMNYKTQTTDVLYDLSGVRADIAEAVRKCYYAGVMVGDNPGSEFNAMRPNDPITREGAILLIAKAMEVKPDEHPMAAFADNNEIADWARPTILTMVDKGWITGSSTTGYFLPKRNITRASVITQIDNIIVSGYFNTKGVQTTSYLGNAIITVDGVELRDVTITGDLIITEGVGDKGKVTLSNCTVKGTVWLLGAGTVLVSGESRLEEIQVKKKGRGPLAITADKNTSKTTTSDTGFIERVIIAPGSSFLTLTGVFRDIYVNAPNYTLTLKNASITNAVFDGYETLLDVSKDSDNVGSYISYMTVKKPLKILGKLPAKSKGDPVIALWVTHAVLGSGATGSSFDIYPLDVTVPIDTTVFLSGNEYSNKTKATAVYMLPNDKTKPIPGGSRGSSVITASFFNDKNFWLSVNLSWYAATDNITLSPNLKYKVYYSESKYGMDTVEGVEQNGIPVMLNYALNLTKTTVIRLRTNVEKYWFNIIVIDEAGNKECYIPVEVNPIGDNTPPSVPPGPIRINPLPSPLPVGLPLSEVTFEWDAATDDITLPQDLVYTLYESPDPNSVFWSEQEWKTYGIPVTVITNTLASPIEFSVYAPNTSKYDNKSTIFNVVVSDAAGNLTAYKWECLDLYAPSIGAPNLSSNNHTVSVSWPVGNDGTAGYVTPVNDLKYKVERRLVGSLDWILVVDNLKTLSTKERNVSSGDWEYRVSVIDEAGNEAPSAIVPITIP